jgi:hypothetical protein
MESAATSDTAVRGVRLRFAELINLAVDIGRALSIVRPHVTEVGEELERLGEVHLNQIWIATTCLVRLEDGVLLAIWEQVVRLCDDRAPPLRSGPWEEREQ